MIEWKFTRRHARNRMGIKADRKRANSGGTYVLIRVLVAARRLVEHNGLLRWGSFLFKTLPLRCFLVVF